MQHWLPVLVAMTVGVLLWVGDVMSGQVQPENPNDILLISMSALSD